MTRILVLAFVLTITAGVATLESNSASAAVKLLSGCDANSLGHTDDHPSAEAELPFSPNFFGTIHTSVFVNNNGNVTFGFPLSVFNPFDLLSTNRVIIAPFLGDVDTRPAESGVVTYGQTTFGGRIAFCVNWVNVGYYNQQTDKLNSFQLLLVDRSDVGAGDFDIIFNYDQIQWESGDGNGVNGLGGNSARVGYSNGVDTALELPGSAVNGALLDGSSGGLVHNSRDSLQSGRYVFAVRGGAAPTGGTIFGQVIGDIGLPGSSVAGAAALGGALVQVCQVDGACNTTTTNSVGQYSVSGLPPGQYIATAFPPPGLDLFPGTIGPINLPIDETIPDQDIFLTQPSPLPDGITITSLTTSSTSASVLNWGVPVNITATNCPGGSASFEVVKNTAVIQAGQMAESSSGLFKGTILPLLPVHGPAIIRINVICPDPIDSKLVDVDVYIDPSGHVLALGDEPIVGATVTLLRSDSAVGPFEVVADGSATMSPSNRTNPDVTDAEGFFHWDVIAGFYKIRAEAPGCVSPSDSEVPFVETGVLEIPPPAFDLELVLDCSPEPTMTPVPTLAPTATPPPTPIGDTNCNDSVDSIDALLILQFTAGLLPSLACFDAGDVNESGDVNSIDSAIILQFVAGLIPSLPV